MNERQVKGRQDRLRRCSNAITMPETSIDVRQRAALRTFDSVAGNHRVVTDLKDRRADDVVVCTLTAAVELTESLVMHADGWGIWLESAAPHDRRSSSRRSSDINNNNRTDCLAGREPPERTTLCRSLERQSAAWARRVI